MLLRVFLFRGSEREHRAEICHLGHEQESVLWCFFPLYPRLVSGALWDYHSKSNWHPSMWFSGFWITLQVVCVWFLSFCYAPQYVLSSSFCLFLRTKGCSFPNKYRAESRGLHLQKRREESICGHKFFPSLSAVLFSVLFRHVYPSELAWRSYLVLIQKMFVLVLSPGSMLSGPKSTIYTRWALSSCVTRIY